MIYRWITGSVFVKTSVKIQRTSCGRLWKISCCENSKTADVLKSKTGAHNHVIVQNYSVDIEHNSDDEDHKWETDSFLIVIKGSRDLLISLDLSLQLEKTVMIK